MAVRIDVALTGRGLCKSRSRAKALLQEGKVLLNNMPCTKPSVLVGDSDVLTLCGEDLAYVGRGGLKLERALEAFRPSLGNRICMDVGASTGGFTDCMLQRGAALVYAIDVGHDQLDDTLRAHAQVVNMEGTDIRSVSADALPQRPDFCSIDVSFISLTLVLPAVYALLTDTAECIALIKPQFEAGKSNLGKHGVVKSAKVHRQVLEEILAFAQSVGFSVCGLCPSPIRGGSGNAEYLIHLKKGCAIPAELPDAAQAVRQAQLNG